MTTLNATAQLENPPGAVLFRPAEGANLMWKWIVALAAGGWAAIVAVAWHLADSRIALCGSSIYSANAPCIIRAAAARDYVLTVGLTVALVAAVLTLIVVAILKARRYRPMNGWSPASRGQRALPR